MTTALRDLLEGHEVLALAAVDADGLVAFCTPALERLLGLPTSSLAGQQVGSLPLADPDTGQALAPGDHPVERALLGESIVERVAAMHQPDGRVSYLRWSAMLVAPDGVRSVVALVQDISAEWVAVRQYESLRDRLVTTLNHELRTPLTKVLAHAELLEDIASSEPLPAQVVASVEAIARGTRDLARLAAKLTHIVDLDALAQVRREPVDVVALVRRTLDAAAEHARASGVALDLVAPDELVAAVDAAEVARAVRELVTNAVAHSPAHEAVQVSLRGRGGDLEVSVADHGPGIPGHDRDRVLQPFERGAFVDPSTSSTGLGLAVVGAVAAAHTGSVVLEDNEPSGLVVRLTLRSGDG